MSKKKISMQLAPELSNRELLAIGAIVSRWGFVEHEVFYQTAQALLKAEPNNFPKAMNNIQFTGVLALWKEHVIEKATGRRKAKLQKAHERICKIQDYRAALVHGMWEWHPQALEKITATRIRKKQIISVHFTSLDLEDFANKLGEINYDIVYPGGLAERALAMAAQGFSVSRSGLALMMGGPIAKDFFPEFFEDAPPKPPATEASRKSTGSKSAVTPV
jgi:hypothetical protein